MKNLLLLSAAMILTVLGTKANNDLKEGFKVGTPIIQSISTMEFGPEGILFLGDALSGQITAIDTKDMVANNTTEGIKIEDLQGKLAAMMGTTPDNVIIHDLAVNPISQTPYLAVSKGNRKELGFWRLPNDVSQASMIIKINADGSMQEFSMDKVAFSQTTLSGLIDPEKGETYRKSSLRVDAITDMVYHEGKVYVTGLSNEEFSSSMRIVEFPFNDQVRAASLEVYHAAHGAYETNAPVRTFVPYIREGASHMITAYTCTPLATFPMDKFKDGALIKSKTVAEFGAGNIPMDMIVYKKGEKDYLMISNSTRNLMRVDLDDVFNMEEGLNTEVKGFEVAGISYTSLPSNGISQIAYLNENNVLALVLSPGGLMELRSLNTKWF